MNEIVSVQQGDSKQQTKTINAPSNLFTGKTDTGMEEVQLMSLCILCVIKFRRWRRWVTLLSRGTLPKSFKSWRRIPIGVCHFIVDNYVCLIINMRTCLSTRMNLHSLALCNSNAFITMKIFYEFIKGLFTPASDERFAEDHFSDGIWQAVRRWYIAWHLYRRVFKWAVRGGKTVAQPAGFTAPWLHVWITPKNHINFYLVPLRCEQWFVIIPT